MPRKSHPIGWYCFIAFPSWKKTDSNLKTDIGLLDISIISTEALFWGRRQLSWVWLRMEKVAPVSIRALVASPFVIILIAPKLMLVKRRGNASHSPWRNHMLASVSFLILNLISILYNILMTQLSVIKMDSSIEVSQQMLFSNSVVFLPETSKYINWNISEWPGSHVLTTEVNSFVNPSVFWRKLGKSLGRFLNSVLIKELST